RVGSVLRATTGTWYGDAPTAHRFRWLRCNSHGTACAPIRGATKPALRLAPQWKSRRIRVLVVAYAPSGPGEARSAPTRLVTG
ncbi:MAG TPA: hypothetical protein VFM43_06845, partial [Gaiellaceae bacterium]|nr:hypothetical protein [Gaiellaceae bacterium]